MPEIESPSLRDWQEVQRAHDLLNALLHDEIPDTDVMGDENRDIWFAVMGTICWVLGHSNGSLFADNMAKIEAAIKGSGFSFGIVPTDAHLPPGAHPPSDTIGLFSMN